MHTKPLPVVGSMWRNRTNSKYISIITDIANAMYQGSEQIVFKGDNGKIYVRSLETWYDVWEPMGTPPKFTQGDWINYYGATRQVMGIEGKYYRLSIHSKTASKTSSKNPIKDVDRCAFKTSAPYVPKYKAGDVIVLNDRRMTVDQVGDGYYVMGGIWRKVLLVDAEAKPYVAPKYFRKERIYFENTFWTIDNVRQNFYFLRNDETFRGVEIEIVDRQAIQPKFAPGDTLHFNDLVCKVTQMTRNGYELTPFDAWYDRHYVETNATPVCTPELKFETTGNTTGLSPSYISLSADVPSNLQGKWVKVTLEPIKEPIKEPLENPKTQELKYYARMAESKFYVSSVDKYGEVNALARDKRYAIKSPLADFQKYFGLKWGTYEGEEV